MNYCCRFCDKMIEHSSKYKHNKSKNHFTLKIAITNRYNNINSNFE